MNYALVFAGGVGSRMNNKALPKQFLEIHGKPILIHTIEHFDSHPKIDAICVVIVAEWIDYTRQLLEKYHIKKVRWIIPGGATAMESQYLGLSIISRETNVSKDDIVLIHDGVRPLIDHQLISQCLDCVIQNRSAVTVAPAIETIVRVNKNSDIIETFPRSECQFARAPQGFYLYNILQVHTQALSDGITSFIDSASMMLFYGNSIHTVPGPAENIKVTNPCDFYVCRALLEAKENTRLFGI